jgi:hypothetical protein
MSENTNENDVRTYAPITPYFAAKVTQARLLAEGVEKEIQGPMMYTYAKNGTIDSNFNTRAPKEKIVFDGASFKNWLDAYVTRVVNGTDGSTLDQLVADYS